MLYILPEAMPTDAVNVNNRRKNSDHKQGSSWNMAAFVELEKKPKLCKSLSEQIENKLNGFLVGIVDLLLWELQHEKPPKSSASLRFVTFLSHCCISSSHFYFSFAFVAFDLCAFTILQHCLGNVSRSKILKKAEVSIFSFCFSTLYLVKNPNS